MIVHCVDMFCGEMCKKFGIVFLVSITGRKEWNMALDFENFFNTLLTSLMFFMISSK